MKRVLIVEDERDLLDSLQEFFEDEGFSVQTAANGAEALSLLGAEELPAVVLLDPMMPVLDGSEALRPHARRAAARGYPGHRLDVGPVAGPERRLDRETARQPEQSARRRPKPLPGGLRQFATGDSLRSTRDRIAQLCPKLRT